MSYEFQARANEVEDALQEAKVFYNGLRTEEDTAHMDSYMTCINYKIFFEMIEKLKDKYTVEQWKGMIKYWDYQSYLSPNSYIIARMFERIIVEKSLTNPATLATVST
jgi:hypothetical protein